MLTVVGMQARHYLTHFHRRCIGDYILQQNQSPKPGLHESGAVYVYININIIKSYFQPSTYKRFQKLCKIINQSYNILAK